LRLNPARKGGRCRKFGYNLNGDANRGGSRCHVTQRMMFTLIEEHVMGDKGGKKDKAKSQKQKSNKEQQQAQKKQEKQQKKP
jgi:hypothetical protein